MVPAVDILIQLADTVIFFLYYREVVSGLNEMLAEEWRFRQGSRTGSPSANV
jgi:hypothetical protein